MTQPFAVFVAEVRHGQVTSARSPAIRAALQRRLDRDGVEATIAFLGGKK